MIIALHIFLFLNFFIHLKNDYLSLKKKIYVDFILGVMVYVIYLKKPIRMSTTFKNSSKTC